MTRTRPLSWSALAYGAASLFHFAHNATFPRDYPNMPPTLTPTKVYAAWLAITVVGTLGYSLVRWRLETLGLLLLAVYGALGLDRLAHYTLAPASAHTLAMNLSITAEVAAAVVLLGVVAGCLLRGGETSALPSA